jgi:hypothetical protein
MTDISSINIKENSLLAKIAAWKMGSNNVSMVIGNTIHLHNVSKANFLKNTIWVKHELCHVEQFKKYGIPIFIVKYLWESIRKGYHNNRFEIEARAAEDL